MTGGTVVDRHVAPRQRVRRKNSIHARVRAVILFHSRRSRCTIRTMRNAATAAAPSTPASRSARHRGAAVRIVGVACGCRRARPALRCTDRRRCASTGSIASLRHAGMDAAWSATIPGTRSGDTFTVVSAVAEALAARTEELVARGRVPVVLGGDHSCAIGTWKGIARGCASAARMTESLGPRLDRRAHGRPHRADFHERQDSRHAARLPAGRGRSPPDRYRGRRAARPAPRMPGRRAQLRDRGGRAPAPARGARVSSCTTWSAGACRP